MKIYAFNKKERKNGRKKNPILFLIVGVVLDRWTKISGRDTKIKQEQLLIKKKKYINIVETRVHGLRILLIRLQKYERQTRTSRSMPTIDFV